MGKTIYLECNAGISGDMTVGALLDLGADEDYLKRVLESLPVDGYEINIHKVKKAGINCTDFDVVLDENHENYDHDMEYLHGEAGENLINDHHHHIHHHEHRGLNEIEGIIKGADMTERARQTALRIFTILARSEAKAHDVPVEEVHFHEVGAVDSIVDVVAVAVCLDNLDVDNVIVTGLCEGKGTVRCAHGILPVPVPAVANIIESHNIPVSFIDVQGEFVTPTGAAIVAAVMTDDKLPEKFNIKKTGMGAGKRNYKRASILRAMWIESRGDHGDLIYKLESNIDDCTGEALGYVMERLLEAGARDVYYIPVYMKKNRPAWQLNVICGREDVKKLEDIIFRDTTTIGIRRCGMERSILDRKIITVETVYGGVKVKACQTENGTRYYPEYESVADICRKNNLSFQEVYADVIEAARH